MITKLTVLWTPFDALSGGSLPTDGSHLTRLTSLWNPFSSGPSVTPATTGSHLTKLTALWNPFGMTQGGLGPLPDPTGSDLNQSPFVWLSLMGSSSSTLM